MQQRMICVKHPPPISWCRPIVYKRQAASFALPAANSFLFNSIHKTSSLASQVRFREYLSISGSWCLGASVKCSAADSGMATMHAATDTASVPAPSSTTINVYCKTSAAAEALKERLQQEGASFDDAFFSWASPVASGQQQIEAAAVSCSTSGDAAMAPFDGHACMAALSSNVMGHVLLTTPMIKSTQDFIKGHATQLGENVVLVADRQSGGKGRGGNQWTSPDGCLMFTCVRRLKVLGTQAPFINYVVCLGVLRGIQDVLDSLGGKSGGVEVRIKWPNDIYTSAGVKIGGALINTTWSQGAFNVITGIGLNVSNRQPTTCLNDLLAQAQGSAAAGDSSGAQAQPCTSAPGDYAPGPITREAVLGRVISRLEECFEVFEREGFAPLEPAYLASWLHSGQRVVFEDRGEAAGAGSTGEVVQRTELQITGLSPQGFLLAADADGRQYELTPDGNSLDMMAGLIRRKIN